MNVSKSAKCGIFKPGHRTHYIQCRVMSDKPRFPAQIELISETEIRVTTDYSSETYSYHDASRLYQRCLDAYEGNIEYSPEAQILWVQSEGPTSQTQGAYFPAYLAVGELTPCGYFHPITNEFIELPQSES